MHVEPSQGLPLPPSVASEAGGTKAVALCTTDVSRTVPAMNCAEGGDRASQGDIKDALPDRGGDIREARCSTLHTQHPCVPSVMASYDRDDDGRCVGALRAQLRASASRLPVPEANSRFDIQGGAVASGSSSSSSRRPSGSSRRPSITSSCALEPSSCAHFTEAASNGHLQEISNVLRGVLTELQELKAGQQRASLEDTLVKATCKSG